MDLLFPLIVFPLLVWPFARWARCHGRRERGLRVVFVSHLVGLAACWILPSFLEGADDCAAEPFMLLLGVASLVASGVVVAVTRGEGRADLPQRNRTP
jgi:hypothetical protein